MTEITCNIKKIGNKNTKCPWKPIRICWKTPWKKQI